MQTDVLLQKALVEEVKEELKNYTSVNNDGEYMKFNVYPQNLPAKKGKMTMNISPMSWYAWTKNRSTGKTMI